VNICDDTPVSLKLLENCRLIDVRAEKVRDGRSLLIKDDRVEKIGPVDAFADTVRQVAAEDRIDCSGRTVLPGLIDAHVHLCVIRAKDVLQTAAANVKASEPLLVLHGARNAVETLKSGYTTVRDVGQGDVLALRDAIEAGVVPGPRIIAYNYLGMQGGHQQCMNAEWRFNLPPRPRDRGVDGPWAVRRRVRELVALGADGIKTFTAGEGLRLHPLDDAWRERPNFTTAELAALVDEAHNAGRRVAAHSLVSVRGVKAAIEAGVDTLEHGIFLDVADVRALREKNIYYVPTLAVVQRMWRPEARGGPQYLAVSAERAAAYLEAHLRSVRLALAAGVPIAAGSDTFRVLKPGENAVELACLVRAGLSPMAALRSATVVAARALGIAAHVGSLEPGKKADLVVLSADPLADISVLRDRQRIEHIMKNGVLQRL